MLLFVGIEVLRVGFLVPMRLLQNVAILIVLMVGLMVFAHHGAALRAWAQTQAGTVRIITPRSGDKLQQNFVTVQFAPLQTPASSTFEVRLDAQDPVRTSNTSYTFTGLNPGPHDLIVQVVDANNTPLIGTQSRVRFTVLQPPTGGGTTQPPAGNQAAQPANQNSGAETPHEMALLPDGHSSLPLLSVIGFGVLVGGVISALKTRPTANR